MISFWPLVGLSLYFGVALLFLVLGLREVARNHEGSAPLAALAALFWPVAIVAILITVAIERRGHTNNSDHSEGGENDRDEGH